MTEHEILDERDLCRPDGRLNPDATGWARRPLIRPNLRGWGRTKRWEYWGILTPTHMVGVTVSSLDYAGVEALYVWDRRTGREIVVDAVAPLARGVVLPPRSGEGRSYARAGGLEIRLDETDEGARIQATTSDVSLDVLVAPRTGDCLAVVVPWSSRRFQYTVKDLDRRVSGEIVVSGERTPIGASTAYAVLDHGRGRWPYAIRWNWSATCGDSGGRRVALQLGGRWTDGTGSTENAVFIDGVAHKIGADLRWRYDRDDWTRPWHIEGPGIDLTFVPEHERVARMNLGVVANETHQCFGQMSGTVTADDGTAIDVDGLDGWAEEAANRW